MTQETACQEPGCKYVAAPGAWTWREKGQRRLNIRMFCMQHGKAHRAYHVDYRPKFLTDPSKESNAMGQHYMLEYTDEYEGGVRYVTNRSGFTVHILRGNGDREPLKHNETASVYLSKDSIVSAQHPVGEPKTSTGKKEE